MNKKKKSALLILSVVLVVIVAAGIAFALYSNKNPSSESVYNSPSESEVQSVSESTTVPEKYNEYYEKNNDFVGWIKIDGTPIDFPVVQCKNNQYYLSHDFYKNPEARGTIFMDYDSDKDLKYKNTVIHGHNWYDETVFSQLDAYGDIDYYKAHPVVEYNTRTELHKWKIISVFITSASESEDNGYIFNYVYPHMGGDNFSAYSSELKKRTLFDTGVDYNENDKFLTLSTCTRRVDKDNQRADCRLVIVSRMVRENESDYVDVSKAVENPNPKYPQIWYTNHSTENPYKSDKKWYPYLLEE